MLHALMEYATNRGLTSEPGFKPKTVRWLLTFNRNGDYLGANDLATEKGSKGREFNRCPHLNLTEIKGGGAGCRHFLVDGIDVLALLTKDDRDDEKLQAKHAYFTNCLDQATSVEPDLLPMAKALMNDTCLARIQSELKDKKAKPSDLATVAMLDTETPILVERETWQDWWRDFRKSLTTDSPGKTAQKNNQGQMRCLLSGDLVTPTKVHPKISGLSDVGGLSMGDALASFKQPSFSSFGLEQAANSAMSEDMAKMYTSTLEYLIKNNSRRLAGTKVVYWYTGKEIRPEEDPMVDLFDGIDFSQAEVAAESMEDTHDDRKIRQAESRAARLLEAIRSGSQDSARLLNARYCALTLSGNSGRVVVRDWMEGKFESLLESIQAWFDDLSIVSRDGKTTVRGHKFLAVLSACVRDLDDIATPLVTALWKAALNKNQPIPYETVAQTLARVKIDVIQDQPARHARLGLLKAYCIRKVGLKNMTEKLNAEITEPAYLCGRIMALLADIQQAALGNVGAGIVQRYYAAASATPGLVLGRLVRLAQTGHLPKIESNGLRSWFEKQMAQVWHALEQAPPATLTLEQQTLFAMGYYQQKAQRYQKGEDQ